MYRLFSCAVQGICNHFKAKPAPVTPDALPVALVLWLDASQDSCALRFGIYDPLGNLGHVKLPIFSLLEYVGTEGMINQVSYHESKFRGCLC